MKRIYVIKEKCNGCMNCVVACQKSHANSEFYAPIRDSEPARIHLQVALQSPVPLVCRHCEEPACVESCPRGAIAYMEDEEFAEYKRQLSVDSNSSSQDGVA